MHNINFPCRDDIRKIKKNKEKRSKQKTVQHHFSYPNVDKDLLIFAASFNRSPSAPDDFCLRRLVMESLTWQQFPNGGYGSKLRSIAYLSEPAKSTRFNLANRRFVAESLSHLLSIIHVNTLWDLLLSLFMFVAATFLFAEPCQAIQNQRISRQINRRSGQGETRELRFTSGNKCIKPKA